MTLEIHILREKQTKEILPLTQTTLKIGSLLSNQIPLTGEGIHPIHALLEQKEDGSWLLTNLISSNQLKVNDKTVALEAVIKVGDQIEIGSSFLILAEKKEASSKTESRKVEQAKLENLKEKPQEKTQEQPGKLPQTIPSPGSSPSIEHRAPLSTLFAPRYAKATGEVLEVVSYWGNTILDVEHFHPKMHNIITIGKEQKADLISGNEGTIEKTENLAKVEEDGYRLFLQGNMRARIRKSGKHVENAKDGEFSLGVKDIAHVSYGPIKYFMVYVNLPKMELPPLKIRDPFFLLLIISAIVFYCSTSILLYSTQPKPKELTKEEIWDAVKPPEPPKPIKPPPKPPEPPKPPVIVHEVKIPPPPPAPPPVVQPKPVEPVKPVVVAKPVPIEAKVPVTKPNMTDTLNRAKTQTPPQPPRPEPVAPPAPTPTPAAAQPAPLAGKPHEAPPKMVDHGSGNNSTGGVRKGNEHKDTYGAQGGIKNKSSGVNLSQLGLGVGQVSSNTGAGAIATNFKSSQGGAGGGSGSAQETTGLGGGSGGEAHNLGLKGVAGVAQQFGAEGRGILEGGQGEVHGMGSGHQLAKIDVRAGDPVVSGGLTQGEILSGIQIHLNEIRHCYERLLQSSPSAQGTMKVQFIVGTDGHVNSVSILSSSLNSGDMSACVSSIVSRWSFPAPRGNSSVTVNYPFVFNPS